MSGGLIRGCAYFRGQYMNDVALENRLTRIEDTVNQTLDQAKKTNGRVNWHDKMVWTALGALPLLTIWAGWLTLQVLNPPINSATIQAAVNTGINEALSGYNLKQ